MSIAKEIDNKVWMADCNVKIGIFYGQMNDFKKAMRYFVTSLKIYKSENDSKGMVDCFINIGLALEFQDKYIEAVNNFRVALSICKKIDDSERLSKCYDNLGLAYSDMGKLDSAKMYFDYAIEENLKNNNISGLSKAYGNLANLYIDQGKYNESIQYFIKALEYAEKLGNKQNISDFYNNIGLVYEEIGNYPKAIDYYQQSLEIAEELGDSISIAYSCGNYGNVYTKQKKYDLAKDYLQKCMKILKRHDQLHGVALCFTGLGIIEGELGHYPEAESYFKNALNTNKEIGNLNSYIISLNNLSGLFVKQKKYQKAIETALEAAELADKQGMLGPKIYSYQYLYSSYDSLKDFANAYKYHLLYTLYNDSVNSETNIKNVHEIESRYQSEKKQLQIENLEKENDLKNTKIQKQVIIIVSVIIGLILLLFFTIVVFRLFMQKKLANTILEKQNTEIRQQKEEISTQRDEIEAQRDEIEAQRDEIEAQRDLVTLQKNEIEKILSEVTSSINYAKRIQDAMLPVSIEARSVLGDHFILFRPKDIVSGDFYWTTKRSNLLFASVADCTGHGVPGAFMSMLGISFLNEIVQKQEVNKASQILNILRSEIINALQQKGISGEQKDGMDISLLVVNTETNEAQWSGANNPLYVIARSETSKQSLKEIASLSVRDDEEELYELKGDKMPIAIYPEMKDFTNHEFTLQKGDCIYLFTDGYADQFGGPKGRKFMYKKFKESLIQNSSKPMNEQKEILEMIFDNWKSGFEQIDDITLLGIKF